MHRLFHWRTVAALWLILSAAGLALSFAGAVWPVFDPFVHFAAHFLGFALIALLALRVRKLGLAVLIIGSMGVIAAPPMLAYMSRLGGGAQANSPAAATARPLRILSFNIYFLNKDLPSIEQAIRRADADIVLLHEFQWTKLPMLAALKDLYPYRTHCAEEHADIYNARCEEAILSKIPWKTVDMVMAPGPKAIHAEFDWGGKSFTVIGVHLVRPWFKRDGLISMLLPDSAMQYRQIERLAALCRQAPKPLILAGDFNATPWSHVIRRLRHETGLRHAGTWLASWPARPFPLPQLAIDQFFVSPGVTIDNVRLGEAGGSDHFGVIGQFSF